MFFICGFFLFSFTWAASHADTLIESSISISTWGFTNAREETDTGVGKSALVTTSQFISIPFIQNTRVVTGYLYSSILESQFLSYLQFGINYVSIESGLLLGFRNELPINCIPGIYEKVTFNVRDLFLFTIYGKTSFFLSPFFSISQSKTQFDQNLFGIATSLPIGDTLMTILYENTNFQTATSADGTAKNSRKKYELSIETQKEDFRINSFTGIGGEIAAFKTSAFSHKLIGFYIAETLIFNIRKIEMNAGIKAHILTLPLKDLESASIPSTPFFSFHAGIKFGL